MSSSLGSSTRVRHDGKRNHFQLKGLLWKWCLWTHVYGLYILRLVEVKLGDVKSKTERGPSNCTGKR